MKRHYAVRGRIVYDFTENPVTYTRFDDRPPSDYVLFESRGDVTPRVEDFQYEEVFLPEPTEEEPLKWEDL